MASDVSGCPDIRSVASLRKRAPILVRAHIRGSSLPDGVADELRRFFSKRPDERAWVAGKMGYDPLSNPAAYLARELAAPEHATLRGKPLTLELLRDWEGQEDAEYRNAVVKESPTATDVHVDAPMGDVSVAYTDGDGKKKKRVKKPETVETSDVKIVKADAAKQLLYGVVLEPHAIDSQGDWESPDDIEKACHRYLSLVFKDGVTDLVNLQHRYEAPPSVYPVENYIAPVDFNLNGEPVKKGTWVLVVKVGDPETWQDVLDGKWGGLSVEGSGVRRREYPAPPA